jgi:DNA-binding NtrC family response regulator
MGSDKNDNIDSMFQSEVQNETERKIHILIIDDDEGIRSLLERNLDRAGYSVSTAANGKHALQKVRRSIDVPKDKIDFIVSDFKTPLMTGVEFISEIRKMGLDTPTALMTGFADKNIVVTAMKAGALTVIVKPFKPTKIIEIVQGLYPSEVVAEEKLAA